MQTKDNNSQTTVAVTEAVETAKSADRGDVEWLAIRSEAGRQIDPDIAEVDWQYGHVLDPYGIDAELPEECQQIGRNYFARSPQSDVWVSFHDLPTPTRHALWKKHGGKLAFPAGLPLDFL
jgi:hypothetical protein